MNKTYTLVMKTYEYDLIKGTLNENVSTVKNCVLYKDADTIDEIWLTTSQIDPEIAPVMITDDRKKIYFLKNWMESQNNFSINNNILRITTFGNDYVNTPVENEPNYRKNILEKILKNVSDFKEEI